MRWMFQAFCSLWWLVTGGLVGSLLACAFRRWTIAVAVAGWSALGGALVFGILILLLVSLRLDGSGATRLLLRFAANDGPEPSQRARAFAETISQMMNSGALACISGVLSTLVWAVARWRIAVAAG